MSAWTPSARQPPTTTLTVRGEGGREVSISTGLNFGGVLLAVAFGFVLRDVFSPAKA